MNYKLLLPTYRTRYRFIQARLAQHRPSGKFARGLHLGAGEGDYDSMIAESCTHLQSCDSNAADIEFAAELNAHVEGLTYRVQDVTRLDCESAAYDLVVSVDVLEHVDDPVAMMSEIGRVLAPGGMALITFPQVRFPFTYDPIHALLGRRTFSIGAYGYGHDHLIERSEFESWATDNRLDIVAAEGLSRHWVGLSEMYWPGLLQSLLKSNSGNEATDSTTVEKGKLRPTNAEPGLVKVTDALIAADRALFGWTKSSVGMAYVLRKG